MLCRNSEELYQEALQAVHAHQGTPYPCSQSDIDATSKFSRHNERPFVSANQANREIVQHNDRRRVPSSHERDAIERLVSAVNDARRHRWGPDLIIKTFPDLDIVFFGGVLRGNVRAYWATSEDRASLENNRGVTTFTRHGGRASIWLNAKSIFLNPVATTSFGAMFSTMLHEMCHAFEVIRVQPDEAMEIVKSNPHGPNFSCKIHAVDRRAKDLLGVEAIKPTQYYRRCYTRGRGGDLVGSGTRIGKPSELMIRGATSR